MCASNCSYENGAFHPSRPGWNQTKVTITGEQSLNGTELEYEIAIPETVERSTDVVVNILGPIVNDNNSVENITLCSSTTYVENVASLEVIEGGEISGFTNAENTPLKTNDFLAAVYLTK